MYDLALLYYESKQYTNNILVCLDLLKVNPDNMGAMEMMAISYETIGLKDKALVLYEKIYLSISDVNILYKMAFLQYDLKKFDEALVNVNAVLSNNLEEVKLLFSFDNESQKEYSMRVPALNLKGLVSQELGNNEEAKKAFEAALAIAPDFKFAKDNLDNL